MYIQYDYKGKGNFGALMLGEGTNQRNCSGYGLDMTVMRCTIRMQCQLVLQHNSGCTGPGAITFDTVVFFLLWLFHPLQLQKGTEI